MKIVVDTNIVFSALLNSNGKIGRILIDSRDRCHFYSCKYLQSEIRRHEGKIRQYSGLNEDDLAELTAIIESRIFFLNEELLPTRIIDEAKELVADVDFDDFAFLATAKYLDAWLWTGDKKLSLGLRQKGYSRVLSTADLWEILNEQISD
jgi:predicted nucleic acid-binding protein